MTKKKKVSFVLLVAMTIAWIAFIFGNSLKNAALSGEQSGEIVDFVIDKILRTPVEKQSIEFVDLVTHFVRKIAHFTEFAILGVLIFFSVYVAENIKLKAFIFSVCGAFFIAVCDELIQLTSEGRACRFTDVIIDSSGALFACILVVFILLILKRKKSV